MVLLFQKPGFNREIDLLLGVLAPDNTNEFRSQNLFTESFVFIVRADHPVIKKGITLESYIAWPHALMSTGSPSLSIQKTSKSHGDQILEKIGVERRVMLKLPHFFPAAVIISQKDMILTLPRRLALMFANFAHLNIFEPPINLGEYNFMQIWHKHSDNIPIQIWLRHLIKSQTENI